MRHVPRWRPGVSLKNTFAIRQGQDIPNMHKLTYLLVTLLSFLLAGCSSDDIIGRTDNPDTLSTAGYLRMSINMPAPHVSRAANDDFHNGLAAEYRINKAFLIILEGDTDDEMKAILHSAYEINLHQSDASTDPSQITTTARIINRLDNGDSDFRSKKHFALLAINTGDMVSVSADHKKINFLGQDFDVATNKITFGDFLKYTFDINNSAHKASAFSPTQGFLMFNAPLASKPGGRDTPGDECKVTCLTDISNAIYDTEREALSATPTNIYVERAVAKVTMPENQQGKLTFKDVEIVDPTNPQTQDIPWKLVGWKLDCTNCVSHIIRNYSTSWNNLKTNSSTPTKPYRFIGDDPVAQGVSLFRTYWAEDPNYSDDGKDHREDMYYLSNAYAGSPLESAADNPVATDSDPYPMGFGDQWPQYCLENTFNVANQTQDQCTSIMTKIQIGNGHTDYYVVNDDKTHLYTWEGLNAKYQIEDKIKEFILNDQVFQEDYAVMYDWFDKPIEPEDLTKDDLEVSLNTTHEGILKIENVFVSNLDHSAGSDYAFSYQDDVNNIALILGQDITIKKYEKGVAYYPIRIKHFGDELTPWKSNESSEVKPNDVYPGSDEVKANNYLGRYGVVRNNWYNVRINSVFGIGEPVIPTPPNNPDDELSNYINVSINVLSWTLRDQGADL